MNIYGVRGYPTPDFTDERHCRTFSIPNTTIALGVFMGALWQLTDPKMWQQYGDMTPDEAADQMLDVIWEAYADDWGICPTLPAPYWDTYDNADDQEPEGVDEPWYGELVPAASMRSGMSMLIEDDELTWRENLGIWAIAGFIAYSGQIGGAIAFIPFARRFVLKFRNNPLGAIAEIFVDGAKLATLDTASDEERISAIDVQLPDDDEHEIWVAVGEDSPPGSTLQVVRKELDPDEVYPTNLRYNSDCDCVQQTYDGGETWVDQPGQDPRSAPQFQFPPVTADDPRCQAAANMTAYFENVIGTALGVLSTGLDALGLATTLMPIFIELGPFAILFDVGLGLATGLVGLGVDVINSEFTPETYDALECIFYCNIQADGSVTDADLADIIADIADQLNPDVQLIMGLCFLLMGKVGLSNSGTIGEAPADCDACDCPWRGYIDLTATAWTYVAVDDPDWGVEGVHDGAGWNATNAGPVDTAYATQMNIEGVFPDGNYRKVRILAVQTLGELLVDIHNAILNVDGDPDISTLDTGDITLEWTGNRNSSSGTPLAVRVRSVSAYGHTANVNPGSFVHYRLEGEGQGDLPDGFTAY